MTNLLIVFIILNIFNVIIQTVKSIVTVKCGKTAAALTNAIAFGLYTVVTVYLMCDLALWLKALIVALCNLVGVYVVKLIEEKARKDRLWKIEIAIPQGHNLAVVKNRIEYCGIPCNYIEVGKWVMFNCYCETQSQTKAMIEIAKEFNGKISAYESKTL
jgi:uncharacterized protein YebE (UPF0316 family)